MQEYKPFKSGKVREIYDIGDSLIMVASDRISAFDHILKNTIGTLFSKKDNGKGMMKPLEVISIAVGGAVGVGNCPNSGSTSPRTLFPTT